MLCVYMAEKRIIPVLDSLFKQDRPKSRWELIIVDDASTDHTAEIVRDRIKSVQNARLVVHKTNKGLGGSRNTGIAKAKGEFIFFTDDDCLPPEDWVSHGVALFRKEPAEVGAIAGDVKIPSHSYIADCIAHMGFPAGGNLGFRRMFDVDPENFTNSFTTANAIARKSVLDELEGPFDESLRKIQDKDVALRIQQKGYRIRYHDDLTVMHMAMPSLKDYLKKMRVKGTYGYYITKKHREQKQVYTKLRGRAVLNIIRFSPKRYWPGIIPLAVSGYGLAFFSYLIEQFRDRRNRR